MYECDKMTACSLKVFVKHVSPVFTGVNAFVFLKTAEPTKCFVAYITVVWFFASVNAFVSFEMAGPRK